MNTTPFRPFQGLFICSLALVALDALAQPAIQPHPQASVIFSKLPLGFEKNEGQFPPDLQFVSRTPSLTLGLTPNKAWMLTDGGYASLSLGGASGVADP